MSRSRPWLIALITVVVEAVVVAVLGSPAVTDSLNRRAARASTTAQDALQALTTMSWRAGRDGLSTAEYTGDFVAIAVLLVLTAVLVLVLTRGFPGGVQVWLATWLAVLAATVVAVLVRGVFATPGGATAGVDRVLFATLDSGNVLYGLALGALGSVCATVAHVLSRRPVQPEVAGEQADAPGVPAAAAQYGYRPLTAAAARGEQATEWLPAQEAPRGGTQPLPAVDPLPDVPDRATTELPARHPVWASETTEFPSVPPQDPDGAR